MQTESKRNQSEWEQEFDEKFSHSDECETLRFADFEKDPFAGCYCQLKDIKSFIKKLLAEQEEHIADAGKMIIDWKNEELGTLVRDLTQVGSIPKSEAKTRILALMDKAREEGRQEGVRLGYNATPKMNLDGHVLVEEVSKNIRQSEKQRILKLVEGMKKGLKGGGVNDMTNVNIYGYNQALTELINKLNG